MVSFEQTMIDLEGVPEYNIDTILTPTNQENLTFNDNNGKRRAVAYCRVSTQGQVGDDRFGIASQKSMIQEYCDKNSIEIIDWFVDEAVSGVKENRPAFDRILQGDVTNPPVDIIIVAKADRISRDINQYYAYKSILSKIGLGIVSVTEDWSAQDKLTAMILENFLAMAATVERENIRIRTSGGRKVKASKGGYSGGRPPYGYIPQNGKLVIVPEEAEVVKYVVTAKDNGSTYQTICDTLNKQGKTNRSGTKFSISTLQVIIDNKPLYEGMYRYGKDGDWVRGEHEPILKGE